MEWRSSLAAVNILFNHRAGLSFNYAERGSSQSRLRHELGCLQKIIHPGRDFELLRNNNGVSGQQYQLVKAPVGVNVARLAADDGSVGVDHKDALFIRLPGGAASII